MQRYNNFLNYQKHIKENLNIFLILKIFCFFSCIYQNKLYIMVYMAKEATI